MSILNPENYYIPCRHRTLGKSIKKLFNNFEPKNLENIGDFEG